MLVRNGWGHFGLTVGVSAYLVVCAAGASFAAQTNDDSAGGNWHVFDWGSPEARIKDKRNEARRVGFGLEANKALHAGFEKPRFVLLCQGGKWQKSFYDPVGAIDIPPERDLGFRIVRWLSMSQLVHVDGVHQERKWNWDGVVLIVDEGTTRELLGAQTFTIEFFGPRGPEVSEFSSAGLDTEQVSRGCGLIPKKSGTRPVSPPAAGGEDSTKAGGNWRAYDWNWPSGDPKVSHKVAFELEADDPISFEWLEKGARRAGSGKPRITLFCIDGRLINTFLYTPDAPIDIDTLRPVDRVKPSFVQADGKRRQHDWTWDLHFAFVDKGSARELLGAQSYQTETPGKQGTVVSTFSPTGIDLNWVLHSCGLTPAKP